MLHDNESNVIPYTEISIKLGERYRDKYGNQFVIHGFSRCVNTFTDCVLFYDDYTAEHLHRPLEEFEGLVRRNKLNLVEPKPLKEKRMGDKIVDQAVEDYQNAQVQDN